jgi:hypothetical protein
MASRAGPDGRIPSAEECEANNAGWVYGQPRRKSVKFPRQATAEDCAEFRGFFGGSNLNFRK